jgi:hypothetical protein
MLPPAAMLDRSGLSNAERAVWMFAGVAVMIAAVAALRTGTRQDAAPATPLMPVVASAPVIAAPSPATPRAAASEAPSPPDAAEPAEAKPPASRGAHATAVRASARTSRVAPKAVSAADTTDKASASTTGKVAQRSSGAAVAAVPEGFDKNAARRALASAAARASQCGGSGARGSVVVTFAPSGLVQSATLAQLSGEDVRQACVVRAFRLAQIAPYVGGPVTVRKSFQLR